MALIPSLPEPAELADVFRRFPKGVRPLLEVHDTLLRGPSDLSVAERELVAAHVSVLNGCAFCAGAHTIIAKTFGVKPDLLEALRNDEPHPDLDERLTALLDYVAKLTRTPSRMSQDDADRVLAAGWSEEALYDAVAVCALFNFMNRIVEGTGVTTTAAIAAAQLERARSIQQASATPYMEFGRRIGVIPGDQ
ncbi:MAG: peroxidase [Deltaproteobacteria bacterium]|nr:MAG: peroxidase [Deltaproteobacteria bacterium]